MLKTLAFFVGLAVVGGTARGQAQPASSVPAVPSATALPLEPVSNWEYTSSVRASVGWRDNLLLSPFAPLARGFGRAEVEAFFLRSAAEWQFISFLNGDVLRYFSPPPETTGEDQWFGHGEVRWQRWPAWRVAAKLAGFRQDAVLDLSETEAVRTIAPARVQGALVTLTNRFELPGGFAVEPLGQVKRTDYRSFAGDYDERRGGARLEWKHGERLELSGTWYEHRRDYAARPQYTAGGRARTGTLLQFWQRGGEVKAATTWSGGGDWQLAVAAGRLESRDRSSGFFDYDQRSWRAEAGWRRAAWQVSFEGDARRLLYRIQTVGTGTAPPPRRADSRETSARIERTLNERWSVFLQHRWERTHSNEPGFSYRATTILGGAQRNF